MPTILAPGDYTVPAPPPPVVTTRTILPALQMTPFELLWGVGRSHPVPNPPVHGTATWTPGEPAVLDFRPARLQGDSDNLYCLRRLAQYLPDFSAAASYTESETYQVSDLSAVQALETDWHIQLGQTVWNPGLQLLPGTPWQVRGFDYVNKRWVSLGVTFDGGLLTAGLSFGAEYGFTSKVLDFVAVTVNGHRTPVNFSQPVTTVATSATVFNKAVQADATSDARPYVLKVGKLTVSYS